MYQYKHESNQYYWLENTNGVRSDLLSESSLSLTIELCIMKLNLKLRIGGGEYINIVLCRVH
jgi:hypothetical protein